jgi:hypothetical protein
MSAAFKMISHSIPEKGGNLRHFCVDFEEYIKVVLNKCFVFHGVKWIPLAPDTVQG